MNFARFLRTPFLQNTSGGCFCILLIDTHQFPSFKAAFVFQTGKPQLFLSAYHGTCSQMFLKGPPPIPHLLSNYYLSFLLEEKKISMLN